MKTLEVVLDLEGVAVPLFFDAFFSDASSFAHDFHVARGDSNTIVTPWRPNGDGTFQRQCTFGSPTSTNSMIKKLAGETVQVTDTQTYKMDVQRFVLDTSSKVSGAMSESFITTSQWVVVANRKGGVTCSITAHNEYKGSWFKGTVEDLIHSTSTEAYEQYKRMLLERAPAIAASAQHKAHPPPQAKAKVEPRSARSRRKVLSESEDEDEEFFDAEEEISFLPASSLHASVPKGLLHSIQEIKRDVEQLKSIVETTHTRLLGLEAAFMNLQEKYIPITSKSRTIKDNLVQYFKRVDAVSKQMEEDRQSKELGATLSKKLDQIESKLNASKESSLQLGTVGRAFLLVLFLGAWPWVASNAWVLAKRFIDVKILSKNH